MPVRVFANSSLLVVLLGLAGLRVHAQSASALAADWPQFRGPGGLGKSASGKPPVTWSATQNLAWKIDLPGPGASSPIVSRGRIFLTCQSGYGVSSKEKGDLKDLKRHLVCLDPADGKILWNVSVPAELPEQDRIREDHGYASSTPVADDRRVIVFFGKSGVFSFDLEGQQLWRADVGSDLNGWGSAASPVIHGDLVIVNASVESQSVIALNRETGKEVWRASGVHDAWNTPLVVASQGGKKELIVPMIRQVLAFDPDSGRKLWSCDNGIDWYICPSAVADGGVVYSIGGRSGGGGLAIRTGGSGDVSGSHVLWKLKKGSNVPSPIHHEGHVYFAHDNLGIVYCLNAKTGELVYEKRLEPSTGMFYASPVLADGRIYYVARDGRTIVLAAKPVFEELARNELGDRGVFNASPAVVGDRLLLRSDRRLYCIAAK